MKYFTRNEAKDKILNYLEHNKEADDILIVGRCFGFNNSFFNAKDYINNDNEADEALRKSPWGIWGAIRAIENYENENFGEIDTDFGYPRQVANVLMHLVGKDVWNEIKDKFQEQYHIYMQDFDYKSFDNETQNKLIEFIKSYDISEEPYKNNFLK